MTGLFLVGAGTLVRRMTGELLALILLHAMAALSLGLGLLLAILDWSSKKGIKPEESSEQN